MSQVERECDKRISPYLHRVEAENELGELSGRENSTVSQRLFQRLPECRLHLLVSSIFSQKIKDLL